MTAKTGETSFTARNSKENGALQPISMIVGDVSRNDETSSLQYGELDSKGRINYCDPTKEYFEGYDWAGEAAGDGTDGCWFRYFFLFFCILFLSSVSSWLHPSC